MKEVKPTPDNSMMSQIIYVEPFTRYIMYVEAHPVATRRHGAISNMLIFTTDMSG